MDTITKEKLKRLVRNSDWEVIYAFKSFMIDLWNKIPVKADDQFNTVWNTAEKQGKIDGLNEFINSIEKLGLDD